MRIDYLIAALRERAEDPCLLTATEIHDCAAIERMRRQWVGVLALERVMPGTVVAINAEFSLESIGLLLAVLSQRCVAAMIPPDAPDDSGALHEAHAAICIDLRPGAEQRIRHLNHGREHPLLDRLQQELHSGIIIFTSGSSGKPKAVLHGTERFLHKFSRPGKKLRTLAFLRLDHIAGLDTLFYTLCAGGSLVLPQTREPEAVCRLIQQRSVEVLPASPTFLNLLCRTGMLRDIPMPSLRIVTYGSEPMPLSTLSALDELLPHARLIQKYGTSEFGSPRAQSRGRDSLWIQLKEDEAEMRVSDGMLWIRSSASMLGYLNAPQPFDAEGWICTGDEVEQDGDWIRIKGRASDIINVGGEKVYPAEVEATLLELDLLHDALVRGESNPLTGQVVVAEVVLAKPLDARELRRVVRRHCRDHLAPYKVPVKVVVRDHELTTGRNKKRRTA